MKKEKWEAEKSPTPPEEKKADMEYYIRQQVRYQKVLTVLLGLLLVVILTGFLSFVRFANKAKNFMADMKVIMERVDETMEQAGGAIEQADETMKQAADFLEAAGNKLGGLDVEGINSAIGKTDELLENMDGIVGKTDHVLSTLDDAIEKTESVTGSIQKFSGMIDGLKKKVESIGGWISKK